MAKSTAFAPHVVRGMLYNGIKKYLVERTKTVEMSTPWVGAAEHQRWMNMINSIKPGYLAALGKRLKTFGSPSKDECNQFLKDHGFSIELDDFVGDNPVGGVAVLHVGVEWKFVGEEDYIYDFESGGQIDAALLTGCVKFLTSPNHENPIAEISCKGPEKVYMTIADQELDGLDLLDRIVEIASSAKVDPNAYYEGLRFPMIDLDVEPDIESLCGITLDSSIGTYELYQAIMQVKFRANHKGAQTDAAAAGQGGIESGPSYLVLNQPFYVWKTLPGLNLPVLVARVDKDAWKNPGDFALNNG
jgi:hypothetical protein